LSIKEKRMAKKPKAQRVSPRELDLLEILWKKRKVTLSEAHEAMGMQIGYTTVQTRLNRLVDKGLAHRSDQRPAQYSAAVTQEDIRAGHFDFLLKRISGGSVVPLVAQLVEDSSLSREEIKQLRKLITEASKKLPKKSD
jgi:BlaI family penicillinase repressor